MIRLLVDSTSDFSQEQLHKEKLYYIPMHINWEGKEYIDGITIQKEEFYDKLMQTQEFPKTSQPSPQSFVEVFEEVKKAKDELICIIFSSALSGTYQSALLAKQIVGYDSIYIVDSKTATAGIQLMVEEAEKKISEGWEANKIAEHLEDFKKKICIYASVDTLEYLKRGGRINKAVASIGEIAKVKPLIHLNEAGEIVAVSKSIGFKKVIQRIAEYANEADNRYSIYTVYTKGMKNLEKLDAKIAEYGIKITGHVQVGSTIGCHIGPEAFGIIYVKK